MRFTLHELVGWRGPGGSGAPGVSFTVEDSVFHRVVYMDSGFPGRRREARRRMAVEVCDRLNRLNETEDE